MRILSLVAGLILGVLPVGIAPAASAECGRGDARGTILRFVREYNAGDVHAADALVAGPETFIRYRVGPAEREWPLSDDRSTLEAYLEERTSHADHLKVSDLELSKRRQGQGWGMTLEITRTSNDPLPTAQGAFLVKGLVSCEIVAWNMGRKP